MIDLEDAPNLTTLKFLILCEESKDMLKNNLKLFESTGAIMASIGNIQEFTEGKQRYFSLESLDNWSYYKKNVT